MIISLSRITLFSPPPLSLSHTRSPTNLLSPPTLLLFVHCRHRPYASHMTAIPDALAARSQPAIEEFCCCVLSPRYESKYEILELSHLPQNVEHVLIKYEKKKTPK